MGLLDLVKKLVSGSGVPQPKSEPGYWVYVRCKRCGEAIRTRIDLRNDLSWGDAGGLTVHKTLVGSRRCFERIEVILTFDDNRQLTERQIERGEFITAEEYAAYEASQSHPDPG